jgi:hypothetical protein
MVNYHWAYEGYVRELIKKEKDSPFYECLVQPEKYSPVQYDLQNGNLEDFAKTIARASIDLAAEVGRAEMGFFGTQLMDPGVDYTQHLDMLNMAEYAIRPDLNESRNRLHQVTCRALANTAQVSRILIEWAYR